MIAIGIDVGSLFTKAVMMKDYQMQASLIIETTGNISRDINGLINDLLKKASNSIERYDICVGTGQGGDFVKEAEFVEDDVACVAAATRHFLPHVSLAVEIGGQSFTTVLSDERGEVQNFMRNDKCASGSGRFIEVISKALQIPIEKLDTMVSGNGNKVTISTQCAVFAESEVVSYVNQGKDPAGIMAGVCEAVARMVIPQALRFGSVEDYTITGGVARLGAVTGIIEARLKGKYHPFPVDPRLASACGAAIIGEWELRCDN